MYIAICLTETMIILLRDFITFDLFHFIPFFRLWDISLHLHECSPFWVGIFIIFWKENYYVYYAYSNWQSTEAISYVIGKSNIMLTWTYIIVLDI